ncbi:hypothetical protein HMN09_01392300 [Mycena chlorophos]|uniref:Uncharacterized protein n=1 Tax=Mycena chlorophos TaxID=658473 RepID=A0A8H6VU75_MYCCL|nr:hypothetical protein HMN09_01392300 [Mycena chlorophos]
MSLRSCFPFGNTIATNYLGFGLAKANGLNPFITEVSAVNFDQLWQAEQTNFNPNQDPDVIQVNLVFGVESVDEVQTYLSYDGANAVNGGTSAQGRQATAEFTPSVFEFACPEGGGAAILLVGSDPQLALTSWPPAADTEDVTAPVTYEVYEPGNPQQIWSFTFVN